MSQVKIDTMAGIASLVDYGGEDSDADSEEETNKDMKEQGLVSYGTDEGGLQKVAAEAGEGGEIQDIDIISDDEMPQIKGLAKVADDSIFMASVNSESAVALSESIRRSCSTDEGDVRLPPEPSGRCSKHLQDKISSYYKKGFNLNQVQTRKDFRNPSIYDKLISYLRIDELGSNYPSDVYDSHGWDENSYYEALAKAQKEDMARREKEKKERTKVEFKMGMARKTPIGGPVATIIPTIGVTGTTTSSSVMVTLPTMSAVQPLLSITTSHSLSATSTDEPERKRKSKWGVVPSEVTSRPLLPLPTPIPTFPITMIQRPQVSLVNALVTNPVGVPPVFAPVTSGIKTTVIPSVGVLKKPKTDK
ncbi:SAP30-binding protein-like isoform X2 [Asterias rubens]|uniref:SAP30-binding protein-like isoform X1 n=1 Tax=Asterias rubens TaxID=7604 RepID=UPI00145575BC|nr:SAP30-binding protein-like isoform X1 [Asterias rubens]XP_033646439.1 SAP30-binding protein-like isoform X2 [Asterias rubens]